MSWVYLFKKTRLPGLKTVFITPEQRTAVHIKE